MLKVFQNKYNQEVHTQADFRSFVEQNRMSYKTEHA